MTTTLQHTPAGDFEGAVTPALLDVTLEALVRRGPTLRAMTTVQISERLGRVCARWGADEAWREQGVATVAEHTGYSAEMVRWSVGDLLRRLTAHAMQALIRAELGSLEPFQSPRAGAGPCHRGAHPPELTFQVLAGTVPPVAIEAIVLALLARTPLLLKTSRDEPSLARWFLGGLREEAPELAEAVAVMTWAGGDEALDGPACGRAQVVVAYGGDEAINALYARCRFPTKFFGYGHRVSFGVIGPDDGRGATRAIAGLGRDFALDASAYDQRGCMSPHLVLVSRASGWSVETVCEAIATGFSELSTSLPRGTLPIATAAAFSQARGTAEFEGRWYGSEQGGAVAHSETRFVPSPGGRLLHVVPWDDLGALEATLNPLRGAVSTVGLFWPTPDRGDIVDLLGRLGARRITRPGRMQRPVWLRDHDGRPRIADWVDWTNVEPLY